MGENTGCSAWMSVILSGSEELVLEVNPRAEGNCSATLELHEKPSSNRELFHICDVKD